MTVKATKHSIAPSGRVALEVLRDREWLERKLLAGNTADHLAAKLKCTRATIVNWIHKHGLEEHLQRKFKVHDEEIATRHNAGQSPGTIANALGIRASDVSRVLVRLRLVGLAPHPFGHHHFRKEWWIDRLVHRRLTVRACAQEAGITPHNGTYWVKKFGLQEHSQANSCGVTRRRHAYKYPQLADPAQLKALMDTHRSYEGVALAVCGRRSGGGNVKTWWLKHFGAPPANLKSKARAERAKLAVVNALPHLAPEWWVERLNKGATMLELAEEAGIELRSAAERLRKFGGDLLSQAYANNARAEKARRANTVKTHGGDRHVARVTSATDFGYQALLVIDPPVVRTRRDRPVEIADVYARQIARDSAVRRFESIDALVGRTVELVLPDGSDLVVGFHPVELEQRAS
jgi:hypothetical protein